MRALLFLAPLLILVSCSNGVTFPVDGGGTSSGGVGAACNGNGECRTGLACTNSKCAPAGTTSIGSSCLIGPECVSGTCGANEKCVTAGTGTTGTSCTGDDDCAAGLRCGFSGTSTLPTCVTAGTGDVGTQCTTNLDCFQGLYCGPGSICTAFTGTPDANPTGDPPYEGPSTGTPWQGVSCSSTTSGTGVTALFHVHRTTDAANTDFFQMPFPNDAVRVSGRLDFSNFPHDPNPPEGFDLVARYLDAVASEPFYGYETAIFRFSGPFDGGSLSPHVIDLATGDERGWSIHYETGGSTRYICPNFVEIRPNRADFMPPGTYAAYFDATATYTPASSDGGATPLPVAQDSDFAAMLKSTAPTDPSLTNAWTTFAPFRAYLTSKGIAPSSILVASVITVADASLIGRQIAATTSSLPAANAPAVKGSWVKCATGVTSPCPATDADAAGGCPDSSSENFDEYQALISLPIAQTGTEPYASSPDGSFGTASAANIFPIQRMESVCASLTVPKATAPAKGYPVAIYAHDTDGSFRSHITDGVAARLAAAKSSTNTENFAVLGIDQVEHGTRRGAATDDPATLFFNWANPDAIRFNLLQGAMDQHSLTGLVASGGLVVPTVTFDSTNIVFWGHGQGANEGAAFLAYDSRIKGAVLSGCGASVIDSILYRTNPFDTKDNFWLAISETSASAVDENHPVLSIMQTWASPADSLFFALKDTLPFDTTNNPAAARSLFQPFGIDDTWSPWQTQATFESAAQLGWVGPQVLENDTGMTATDQDLGLASMQATVTNNGQQNTTTVFREYAAASGDDGHVVALTAAKAEGDVDAFLAAVALGLAPTVPAP